MTVTIELDDRTAEALSGLAREKGLSIEALIISLLYLPTGPVPAMDIERALDELELDPDEGVALPADFSRADLYDDHD